LNFSFSFRFVDENCRIFVVVVVFVTKINLFSSTKIFVFIIVHEKKHWHGSAQTVSFPVCFLCASHTVDTTLTNFGNRYLVEGFSEWDEIWQLDKGALLYNITQIAELWQVVPWVPK